VFNILQTLCLGQALTNGHDTGYCVRPQSTCARVLATVTLQANFREANFRERGIVSGHSFTEV
jgi:hypothetical protein